MKTARRNNITPDSEVNEPKSMNQKNTKQTNDEKTSCFCQTKGGAVLKCSRASCVVGSFHLSCVGLDSFPDGNWFCNECSDFPDNDTDTADTTDERKKTVKNVGDESDNFTSKEISHQCKACEKI